VLAGIAAWAAGCVLCWLAFALVSAATPTSTPDWLVFLLGYLPLWLLTALLLRNEEAVVTPGAATTRSVTRPRMYGRAAAQSRRSRTWKGN
jgi:hypothetical protein